MTRAELMESIKHLKWARHFGILRCERGDCPVVAAAKLKFPEREHSNGSPYRAAADLGLPIEEAAMIIEAADHYGQLIPELEGERPVGGAA